MFFIILFFLTMITNIFIQKIQIKKTDFGFWCHNWPRSILKEWEFMECFLEFPQDLIYNKFIWYIYRLELFYSHSNVFFDIFHIFRNLFFVIFGLKIPNCAFSPELLEQNEQKSGWKRTIFWKNFLIQTSSK